MKARLITFLFLSLVASFAFAQGTKVSSLPVLPAYDTTYFYGITNSGTDGKVPVNAVGGIPIYSDPSTTGGLNRLLPFNDATISLGYYTKRWSGIYMPYSGGIFWVDSGFTSEDQFYYQHGRGPLFQDGSNRLIALSLQSIGVGHSWVATFLDRDGTLAYEPTLSAKSANYTTVLADANNSILHASADATPRTFTIPANTGVAYTVGTKITFINQHGAGTITIAITTDTMRLAGAGTTGSRTLAADGIAIAVKITSTEWIIYGTNLT